MSGFISTLLAKEKSTISSTLSKLETASGEEFIDNQLTSEIIVKSKLKIRHLGLDPDDTNAEELHLSLINLAKLHDSFLVKSLGAKEDGLVKDLLPKITTYAEAVAKRKRVWGLKHAVAKRMIKSMPPKNLMKKLGYRSLDSMIKHESVDDLYAGIRITETNDYLAKFFDKFKKLSPSDFESKEVIGKASQSEEMGQAVKRLRSKQ